MKSLYCPFCGEKEDKYEYIDGERCGSCPKVMMKYVIKYETLLEPIEDDED